MNKWIQLLTCSRGYLGMCASAYFAFGEFESGMVLFTIGLLTKAIDTPLAEWRKCPIPADDDLYRIVAVAFNGIAFLGLMYGICRMAYLQKLSWLYPILLLAIVSGLMSVSLLGKWVSWVKPHSIFSKVRSGIISFVIVCFVCSITNSLFIQFLTLVSMFLIMLGEAYKASYYSCQKTPQT